MNTTLFVSGSHKTSLWLYIIFLCTYVHNCDITFNIIIGGKGQVLVKTILSMQNSYQIVYHQWVVAIQFVSELDSYIFGIKDFKSIFLSKQYLTVDCSYLSVNT